MNIEKLKKDCSNALRCLYLEAHPDVAENINKKVKGYIEELEKEIESLREENKKLKE